MRAYYASKISENISKMPGEGFLICRNVPIARTGPQQYAGVELDPELGLDADKMYDVHRPEDAVFSRKAMASFEGKPATDDHPAELVTSENATLYIKGYATNIRRGEGAESNLLLADLIIYDQHLIDEIMDGKREISCGYDCDTVLENGQIVQRNIRGNHVAVVDAGRAGPDVCIKDQAPRLNSSAEPPKTISIRRNSTMSNKSLKDKIASFLGMTKDADPQEAAALIAEIAEQELQGDEETPPVAPAKQDNEPAPAKTDNDLPKADSDPLLEAVKLLTDNVQKLTDTLTAQGTKPADSDPLAAVEAELAAELADESGESAHTAPAESIDEDPTGDDDPVGDDDPATDEDPADDEDPAADDDPTADEDPTGDSESGTSTADKKAVLAEIRRMKPVIAGMKDGKAKKAMADSLTRLARTAMGKPATGRNGYKHLNDARANALKKRSKAKPVYDATKAADEQQAIYDRFDPHRKESK